MLVQSQEIMRGAGRSKYKKNSASKSKKHQIAKEKIVYGAERTVKYITDVTSEAFMIIKFFPSNKSRFSCAFLHKAPSS